MRSKSTGEGSHLRSKIENEDGIELVVNFSHSVLLELLCRALCYRTNLMETIIPGKHQTLIIYNYAMYK